jgi:hypothetical protein
MLYERPGAVLLALTLVPVLALTLVTLICPSAPTVVPEAGKISVNEKTLGQGIKLSAAEITITNINFLVHPVSMHTSHYDA